jgi:hypothetical protein
MCSISNAVACFHFAVFFALKEMVTIHINFMATSTHDARFNDLEAKFLVLILPATCPWLHDVMSMKNDEGMGCNDMLGICSHILYLVVHVLFK